MDEVPPIDGPAPGSAPAPTDQGPPPETTPAHTPELSKKKGRILLWALAGLVALGLAGCGLVLLGLDAAITHDLVDADFTSTAEPFHTGTHGEYRYDLSDGAYKVTAKVGPTSAGTSLGEYERVAYNVDTSMRVLRVDGEDSMLTLGCMDQKYRGYELVLDAEGAALGRVTDDGGKILTSSDSTTLPSAPFTMSISCTRPPAGGVELKGYVDGRRVVQADLANGTSDWAYATVGYWPDSKGQSMVVDDVVAHVPGE